MLMKRGEFGSILYKFVKRSAYNLNLIRVENCSSSHFRFNCMTKKKGGNGVNTALKDKIVLNPESKDDKSHGAEGVGPHDH